MKSAVKNRYHLELINELRKQAVQETKHQQDRDKSYLGTTKFSYGFKTSVRRQIVKDWIKKHPQLSFEEYRDLLSSLYSGKSHDEISLAGKLLKLLPKLRKQLDPVLLNRWLESVEGWAEVDSICQSKFSAGEMLAKWRIWNNLIKNLSINENVHKKRASLVLLTKPVRDSADARLTKLAFANIDRLKNEKDILITKAISWLLRDLIKNHRKEVEEYLEKNKESLPKIAVREVSNKLETGLKSGKK